MKQRAIWLVGYKKKRDEKNPTKIYRKGFFNQLNREGRTPVIKTTQDFPWKVWAPLTWKGQPKEASKHFLWGFFGGHPKDATKTERPVVLLVATQIFFFVFTPRIFGENGSNSTSIFFQMGWFNHQQNAPCFLAVYRKKKKHPKRARSFGLPRLVLSSTICWHQMICSMAPPMTCDRASSIFEIFLQVKSRSNKKGDDDTYLLTAC